MTVVSEVLVLPIQYYNITTMGTTEASYVSDERYT